MTQKQTRRKENIKILTQHCRVANTPTAVSCVATAPTGHQGARFRLRLPEDKASSGTVEANNAMLLQHPLLPIVVAVYRIHLVSRQNIKIPVRQVDPSIQIVIPRSRVFREGDEQAQVLMKCMPHLIFGWRRQGREKISGLNG